jgi:MFS transporter, OFA family, oxalate/formate antiporter
MVDRTHLFHCWPLRGRYYSFGAFFEPLVEEFGWSYTQISFATSLRGLEMSVFAPFIGFLVDRFGSRKLIVCGTITVGIALVLLSVTQSLITFYASFLLLAFGAGGCASVVLLTVVANWFDKNAGKALAVVTCGFGAGGLITPLVVWLIDLYGWRTTLIILGLGVWTLGIPLSFVIRDKPEQYGYIPDGESAPRLMSHPKNEAKGVEISFKEVLKQRVFLYLTIVELIRQTICQAVITHIMPYLSSIGIPRAIAGILAAAIPLFSIAGRLGFGWLGDVYDKRYTMALATCLMGIGILAFSCVQQRWVILFFLLLFSLGGWGSMILSRTMQREYFGRESFGKILGIIMGFASIGGIIGPTLAGWVFDTLGSYHLIWLAFCGFSGLSMWLILRIKPLMKINGWIPLLQRIQLTGKMVAPSKETMMFYYPNPQEVVDRKPL